MTELNSRENDPVPHDAASSPILSSEIRSDAGVQVVGEFVGQPSAEPIRPETSSAIAVPVDSPPCWYRGVGEALGWWIGTWLVHLIAAVFVVILLIFSNFVSGKARPMDVEDSNSMMIITTGEMILFVLAAILAVSVRFWGRVFNELNFSRPDPRHVWMVIAGTLPLTFCVSIWSMPIQLGWDALVEAFPNLKILDGANTMELIKDMADKTPLWVMIFTMALLPAIGEELVFRGAIGRTLIANLGLWGGVLLTSIIFGWVHVHPVHALAVMPLGLVIHLVYLWTRSFWLPMLLHFVNNFWAAVAAHYAKVDPVGHGDSLNLLEGFEIVTALIAVAALGFGLWQSRVQLVTEDGSAWNAGRFPVRVPTDHRVQRLANPMNPWCWRVALVSSVCCHVMVVLDLMNPS